MTAGAREDTYPYALRPATCCYLKLPVKSFFVKRRLRWMSELAALGLMRQRSLELNNSAHRLSQHSVAYQLDTL
jgi:hypothetical protein